MQRRAGIVARRFGQRLVQERDDHRSVSSAVPRQAPTELVGSLHAGGNLVEKLLEQGGCLLSVTSQPVELRGPRTAAGESRQGRQA